MEEPPPHRANTLSKDRGFEQRLTNNGITRGPRYVIAVGTKGITYIHQSYVSIAHTRVRTRTRVTGQGARD